MRKQLGILTSLLFLSVSALLWTGCSNYNSYGDDCCAPCEPVCEPCRPTCPPPCKPVCAEPCKPVCPPPCAPAPCAQPCPPRCAAPLKPCKYGTQGECCCNGVTVRAKNPNMCMLGDQYALDIEISACIDVCDVTISTTLPDGVSFIRSQPEAKVDGRNLVWQFGHRHIRFSKELSSPCAYGVKCAFSAK